MPDPVSIYFGTKALETAADLMGKQVLGRWADYRARRFIEQFVEAVASEMESSEHTGEGEVNRRLQEIVEDDAKSAALFDAFRHVFWAASREIGPRAIALHMAEVVGGRVDDVEVSEMILSVSGMLADFEFEEFLSYAASHGVEARSFESSLEETFVVVQEKVDFDSNWRGRRAATGPLPLRAELGSWALKFERVGLLVQDISEEEFDYQEDGERHIDEPGTVRRVHLNIELREGTSHLFRLVTRAQQARDSS